MRTSIISALAAATVLGLTACGGSGDGNATSAASSAASSNASSAASSAASSDFGASSSTGSEAASSSAGETSTAASESTSAAAGGAAKTYTNESLAKVLTAAGLKALPPQSAAAAEQDLDKALKEIAVAPVTPASCAPSARALFASGMQHVALAAVPGSGGGRQVDVFARGSVDEAQKSIDDVMGMARCPEVTITSPKETAGLKGTAKAWQVEGADSGVAYTGVGTTKKSTTPLSLSYARVGNVILAMQGDKEPSATDLALVQKVAAALKADQSK